VRAAGSPRASPRALLETRLAIIGAQTEELGLIREHARARQGGEQQRGRGANGWLVR